MPFYEYECETCGKKFSVKRTMKDHTEKRNPKCPQCQRSRPVRPVLSAVHVQTSKKS